MNGLDIRTKIDANNKLIESLLKPNKFTLNNTISSLLNENRKLQEKCIHEFRDGFCIYCDKEES